MSSTAPSVEKVVIDGPAGAIEGIIERPPDARDDVVAVCCHPHSLYGGAMQNKVVHTLARSCQDALKQAEQKVDILLQKSATATPEPFEPDDA